MSSQEVATWNLFVLTKNSMPLKIYRDETQAALDIEDYRISDTRSHYGLVKIPNHMTDFSVFPPPGVKFAFETPGGPRYSNYEVQTGPTGEPQVMLVWVEGQ